MELVSPPKKGEIIEGKIISRGRSSVYLDLGAKGIGIIYGREFFAAKDNLKNLDAGEKVAAKVLGLETDEGYRELSLAGARQDLVWEELLEIKEKEEIIEVPVKGANKGGLVCEIKGIQGFLPASQLNPEHYPKVEGADPTKIARELQKLVGEKVKVKIFDLDQRQNKVIFSEKATKKEERKEELSNYKTGDIVEGEISGITNFGAFVKFGENLEGLIHASEISEKEEEKPSDILKIGQKIKAKIIEIAKERVYLSLKKIN